jgi:hypothetical protein
VAAWLSPVVLAALAARVVAGDASAPTLVAVVAAAALVGLLVSPRVSAAASRPAFSALPVTAALVLVLAANLVVMGDLARLLGLARVYGVATGVVLALGVVGWTAGDRWWRLATPLGAVMVLLPLGLVVTSAGSPWAAWAAVASRPALTFGESSAWVTQGRALGERAPVTFHEPHRVVAATPATWRVLERDTARVAVREWRLGAGEALTLRPGDQLVVDTGARVRFEAGRRVPGAPTSGMAWADGRRRPVRETLVMSVGAAVTLVGGGVALAPALPVVGAATILTPALLLAFVVGATLWGVYGIALAPELSLVPRALAPILEVLTRVVTPPWRQAAVALVVAGVVVLFLGVVLAWRARLTAVIIEVAVVIRRPAPPAWALAAGTAGAVAVAALVAARGADPWRLFTWGLGLAAAAAVAPRLAGAGARGELVGAVVGALAFGVAVFGDARLPAPVGAFLEYPAVMAAPLAWLAAWIVKWGAPGAPQAPHAPRSG